MPGEQPLTDASTAPADTFEKVTRLLWFRSSILSGVMLSPVSVSVKKRGEVKRNFSRGSSQEEQESQDNEEKQGAGITHEFFSS